jgi:ABC-type proline/glycine betaine transport system ATPase subunit
VLVTHDWADAKTLSDKVVVLNEGRIEQEGKVADLIERPASDFVRSVTGASSACP